MSPTSFENCFVFYQGTWTQFTIWSIKFFFRLSTKGRRKKCIWCIRETCRQKQGKREREKKWNDIANKRWKIYCFFVSNRTFNQTVCAETKRSEQDIFNLLANVKKKRKIILMAWIYLHFKSLWIPCSWGYFFMNLSHFLKGITSKMNFKPIFPTKRWKDQGKTAKPAQKNKTKEMF